MSLLNLISENSELAVELALSSDEVAALASAYDAALIKLDLSNDDPKAPEVALFVVTAAKHGERNPDTLRDLAVAYFEQL